MTRRTFAWLLCVTALPGISCATGGGGKAVGRDRRPDWISGEALEWPRQRYVLGVGVADDRATAEDRARAEISRVFSTQVEARTSAYAAETSTSGTGRDRTVQERNVVDDTQSFTAKVLEGVQIVETWQDPTTRQVYALATLDRRQAAARLRDALATLDAEAGRHASAMGGEDRVAAATGALRWRGVQRRKQPVLADLRVVVPDEKQPRMDPALEAKATEALGRLDVVVHVEGDRERTVEAGVGRALASMGMRPRAGTEAAAGDVKVSVQVSVEDLGEKDGWYLTRAAGAVTAAATAGGKHLAQVRITERGSATLQGESAPRALKRLADAIATKLPEAWAAE